MRTLSVITDNIANVIQDPSAEARAVIRVFINKRYYQILRAINWNYINEDYTITLTAGTQDYNLPTDFKKELYATDETNNLQLTKLSLEEFVRDFVGSTTDTGSPQRYVIFRSDDGNTKVRFHYNPDKAYTIQFPYIVKPAALSVSSDTPVLDIEDLLEVGVLADMWQYKRQFSKSRDMAIQFSGMLQEYIWDEYNQPGKVYQFKPAVFNRDSL